MEARRLPVRIAGTPTRFQLLLHRLGFWVPGIVGDPSIQLLSRLNGALYVMMFTMLAWLIAVPPLMARGSGYMTAVLGGTLGAMATMLVLAPIWYAIKLRRCPTLAAQRAQRAPSRCRP